MHARMDILREICASNDPGTHAFDTHTHANSSFLRALTRVVVCAFQINFRLPWWQHGSESILRAFNAKLPKDVSAVSLGVYVPCTYSRAHASTRVHTHTCTNQRANPARLAAPVSANRDQRALTQTQPNPTQRGANGKPEQVDANFHSRYSASYRRYRYDILNAPHRLPLLSR